MTTDFDTQIAHGLAPKGHDPLLTTGYTSTGTDTLPSCFKVGDLAQASIGVALGEVASLTGAAAAHVDRRLAQLWFDMTLRPTGWTLPGVWDVVAGVYQTHDGWIRLHTNAPHHRDAALSVLGAEVDRNAVAHAVARWAKDDLEQAIVGAGGCAAAMRSMEAWANHPQGKAVAAEPLIHWADSGQTAAPVALTGLKVLDLTRVLAGPVATRFLAAFGADVLRIDPPDWDEPGVIPEVTLGKTCAGLDLRQTADRASFEHLLSQADVLVHGYRPGALDGLGYGPEARQKLSGGHIDVSLCAYGHSGPWAGRRGFDSLVQMSCGIAHEGMIRADANAPTPLPVQALDHATGYLMAAAVLRALRIRNATGQVFAARTSLARTAALLMSRGAHPFEGDMTGPHDTDFAQMTEKTGWGPAHRVMFPASLEGNVPTGLRPSGPLRRDPPHWAHAN